MTHPCRLHEHGREYPPADPCTICHSAPTRLLTCACCGATGLVPPCDHRTAPADVDAPMAGSPLAGGPVLCWRCGASCNWMCACGRAAVTVEGRCSACGARRVEGEPLAGPVARFVDEGDLTQGLLF